MRLSPDPQPGLSSGRRTRRTLTALALAAVVLLGAGCGSGTAGSREAIHEVHVVNYREEDDAYVDVYLNDGYMGTVYLRSTFYALPGHLRLFAAGTGPRGSVFTASALLSEDVVWTLCP